MTKSQISVEDLDRAMGVGGPDGTVVALFRDAGFGPDEALRGAAMMESGQYFGFVDAATSLLHGGTWGGRGGGSSVTEAGITRVAEQIAEKSPAGGTKVSIDEEEYDHLLAKGDRLHELEAENALLKAEGKRLAEKSRNTPSLDDLDEALGLDRGEATS